MLTKQTTLCITITSFCDTIYRFIYLFTCLLSCKNYQVLTLKVLEIILVANKCRTRKNNLDCTYRFLPKMSCSGGRKKASNPSEHLSANMSPALAINQRKHWTLIQEKRKGKINLNVFLCLYYLAPIWTVPYEKLCTRNSYFFRNLEIKI